MTVASEKFEDGHQNQLKNTIYNKFRIEKIVKFFSRAPQPTKQLNKFEFCVVVFVDIDIDIDK